MKTMFERLAGKSIVELIAEGNKKVASLPSAGAGGAPAAPTKAAEAKKEEVVEEEEADVDMGGLFGDDY